MKDLEEEVNLSVLTQADAEANFGLRKARETRDSNTLVYNYICGLTGSCSKFIKSLAAENPSKEPELYSTVANDVSRVIFEALGIFYAVLEENLRGKNTAVPEITKDDIWEASGYLDGKDKKSFCLQYIGDLSLLRPNTAKILQDITERAKQGYIKRTELVCKLMLDEEAFAKGLEIVEMETRAGIVLLYRFFERALEKNKNPSHK